MRFADVAASLPFPPLPPFRPGKQERHTELQNEEREITAEKGLVADLRRGTTFFKLPYLKVQSLGWDGYKWDGWGVWSRRVQHSAQDRRVGRSSVYGCPSHSYPTMDGVNETPPSSSVCCAPSPFPLMPTTHPLHRAGEAPQAALQGVRGFAAAEVVLPPRP